MNTLPDPKEVGNAKAAEILLAHGWEIYPDALPYGEFFIIPRADGYHDHQVACLAYRTFYEQQRAQQSMHLIAEGGQQPASYPLQLSLFADESSATFGGGLTQTVMPLRAKRSRRKENNHGNKKFTQGKARKNHDQDCNVHR